MDVLIYRPGTAHLYLPLVREALVRRGIDARVTAGETPAEAEAALPSTGIALVWGLPPGLFGRATGLRWVQSIGAGVDALLNDPSLPAGVPITRVTGHFGPLVAEYVMAHLLAIEQDLRRAYRQQAGRVWAGWVPGHLRGRRLGLAGVGEIGRVIAGRAKSFEMVVAGLRRGAAEGRAGPGPEPDLHLDAVYGPEELDHFLADLDYLVITLPLTAETAHLFGRREFERIKPGAWVINVGRGPTIDTEALITAIESGRLGGAVLDVHETEPLPPASPLWSMPNVTITPHISGLSDPAFVADFFGDNARRYLDGLPLKGLVDRARGY